MHKSLWGFHPEKGRVFIMLKLTDKELLLLIKNDNDSDFDELYNRYWLARNKRAVRETGNVPACLSAAAKNKIYTLLADGKTGYHFVQPFENMISTATADSSFNQKEINHLLYLGMQTLPEKRREIFRLPYY